MAEIAIIAALHREIAPLVGERGWRRSSLISGYRCFENGQALVVCAGIGESAARAAAQAVISVDRPEVLISAGLAGALAADWEVGRVMIPQVILRGESGAVVDWNWSGELRGSQVGGILLTGSRVAGQEAKRLLAQRHGAQAIDMEAGPVADLAAESGIPFVAVKAICDQLDFPMPDLAPYIDRRGKFHTLRFVLGAALFPRRWPAISKLASHSNRASHQLCRELRLLLQSGVLATFSGRTEASGFPALRPVERSL